MKLLDWELKKLEKYPRMSKQEAYQRLENGKEVLCFVEPRSIYLISDIVDFNNTINLVNAGVYKASFYKYAQPKIKIEGIKEVNPEKLYELQVKDLEDFIGQGPVIVQVGSQYFVLENNQDLRKIIPYETAERRLKFFIN